MASSPSPVPSASSGNVGSQITSRPRTLRIPDEETMVGHHQPNHSAISPGANSYRRNRLHELSQHLHLEENKEELVKFWDRFMRKGKKKVGVKESLRNLLLSSWLNVFLLFIPPAWAMHFAHPEFHIAPRLTFALSFFAILPLERLFDYGGEQMAYYLGKDLGDLIVITLNNAVEATLAIILLKHCELQLLKSTIIGVVILHLLLVPGMAFLTGGARIIQQDLHPHLTQLNHTLLSLGVLCVLLPAAFFAALDTSFAAPGTVAQSFVTDETRDTFLKMSRGLAIFLLVVYVCSRFYLHNPPGEDNALNLHLAPLAPVALKEHVDRLHRSDPELNQWVCIGMLAVCIALMAATAEFLVKSLEFVEHETNIRAEWFGLILIPFVSFAADGTVAAVYFLRYMFRHFFREPMPPATLAKAEGIDLSIQFTLFWMPFFVLLAWWENKPLSLLFDLFDVAILIGSCFIVNYVTADSKTNWAEGAAMVSFYCMIALCAWYYPGQPEIQFLSQCGTVAAALANLTSGNTTGTGAH